MVSMVLLLLEDNPDRVSRMTAAILRARPGMEIMVWADARVMVREAGAWLERARVVSLDHDLDAGALGRDPGDGLEVARYLVTQPVARPVIVHTSNSDRGRMMMGEFELARWPCERVLPFGDDWIETEWAEAVVKRLAE